MIQRILKKYWARKYRVYFVYGYYAIALLISTGLYLWGVIVNGTQYKWGEVMVRESAGVSLLFILPLLMQVVGYAYLCVTPVKAKGSMAFFDFYISTMFLCAGFNYGLWLIYLYKVRPENQQSLYWPVQWLSYVALVCIALLLLSVAAMTLSFLTPDNVNNKKYLPRLVGNIKNGASRRPFWALLHSMAVFLTITYLFAFAFAFHDLTVPKLPAQKTQDAAADGKTPGTAPLPPLYMANLPNYGKVEQGGPKQDKCYRFRFEEGQPDLNVDDGENSQHMIWTVDKLVELAQEGSQVHILLVGHADNKPVKKGGAFPDNYTLSQARVSEVERQIKTSLDSKNQNHWINAEWEAIPWSNAQSGKARAYLQGACGVTDIETDGKLVEVYITAVLDHPFWFAMKRYRDGDFQRLDLLDHIYFATYTITTTGYGDIIPTTRYTKFLTCLANICEVFFMVIFFNSLMALISSQNQKENRKPDDARPPSGRQPGQPRRAQAFGRRRRRPRSARLP